MFFSRTYDVALACLIVGPYPTTHTTHHAPTRSRAYVDGITMFVSRPYAAALACRIAGPFRTTHNTPPAGPATTYWSFTVRTASMCPSSGGPLRNTMTAPFGIASNVPR